MKYITEFHGNNLILRSNVDCSSVMLVIVPNTAEIKYLLAFHYTSIRYDFSQRHKNVLPNPSFCQWVEFHLP